MEATHRYNKAAEDLKDDYYRRNRDWVLEKKRCKRQGLPPPPKPADIAPPAAKAPREKPPVDPEILEARKQAKNLNRLIYMDSYNREYYQKRSEELKERSRIRRLLAKDSTVPKEPLTPEQIQQKADELKARREAARLAKLEKAREELERIRQELNAKAK